MSTTEIVTGADAQAIRAEIAPIVARAQALKVRDAEERAIAIEFGRAVKVARNRVTDFFGPIVDASHRAWKRACEGRASLLDPLEQAERRIKTTVMEYDRIEEEARLAEQRRLQAIADEKARKEREKAEALAQKQRDILRQQEEAAAAARHLAERANAEERARLLADAAAADRKAAAAAAKAEAREEQAACVIAPVVVVAGPEKQKGESTRKIWKARLRDKGALVQAAAAGNDAAASLLAFDDKAANRLAGATKGSIAIPGIEWYAETILAVKGE